MRKANVITALALAVVMLAIMTTPAVALMKYTIDGDLSDWGLDLVNDDWSLNATWVPDDGIEFRVEDNMDPMWSSTYNGVHIRGTAPTFVRYYEEMVLKPSTGNYVPEPVGGEKYDIEAKYLDEDDGYIYYAVVTSLRPDATGNSAPGDLAMELDNNIATGEFGYEYGVKLGTNTGLSQWDIGYLPDWELPTVIPDNKPSVFKGYQTGGYKNGTVTGAYVNLVRQDHGVDNWIIEMAIPKNNVSMAGKSLWDDPLPKMIHLADACGNDHVDNPIPEFTTIAIPVAGILGLVLFFNHRKHKKE